MKCLSDQEPEGSTCALAHAPVFLISFRVTAAFAHRLRACRFGKFLRAASQDRVFIPIGRGPSCFGKQEERSVFALEAIKC
nr:putative integron gene cassette protein [uncultured bacterium]